MSNHVRLSLKFSLLDLILFSLWVMSEVLKIQLAALLLLHFSRKDILVDTALQLTLSFGPVFDTSSNTSYTIQNVRTSLGAAEARIKDPLASFALDYGVGYHAPYADRYHISVSPIMYNGVPLFGWFHIHLIASDSFTNYVRWVVMEADIFEPGSSHEVVTVLGEFVDPKMFAGTNCESQVAPIAATRNPSPLSKANLLPSFFTHDPNPFVSKGFGYEVSSTLSDGVSEIHLNWRMNLPPCGLFDSTRFKLHFRGMVINYVASWLRNDHGTVVTRAPSIFLKNYVYGAHDPAPEKNAQVSCLENLEDPSTWSKVRWIDHVDPRIEENILSPRGSCSSQIKDSGTSLFYGSCHFNKYEKKRELDQNEAKQFSCDSPADENAYYKQLPPMSKYIEEITRENKRICKACLKLESATIADAFNNKSSTAKDIKGEDISSEIGRHIWSLRQGHAVFAIFVTMFLFPVSNFCTRYFKETFLVRKLINMHVWYTIHILGSMCVLCGLIASLTVAVFARSFLGYSRDSIARFHTLIGWWAVVFFVGTFISSGFRRYGTLIEVNVTVGLHFLGGAVFYILCLISLMLSCYIPGSPSAYKDSHMNTNKSSFEHLILIFGFWVAFDIIMHCVMMNLIMKGDSIMGLDGDRVWAMGLVPLPVVGIYDEDDLPGRKLRIRLLILYTTVSATLTLVLWTLIGNNSPLKRSFGPMVSTHTENFDPIVLDSVFYSDID